MPLPAAMPLLTAMRLLAGCCRDGAAGCDAVVGCVTVTSNAALGCVAVGSDAAVGAMRSWLEAEDTAPAACEEILDHIGALYAIGRQMKDRPPDELLAARQTRSKRLVQQIQQCVFTQRTLPQSALGKPSVT